MTNQNVRPITLTLSKRHVEMMVKTHRLKEADSTMSQRSLRLRSRFWTRLWGFPRTVGMRGTIGRKGSNDRHDLMQGKDAMVGPRQLLHRK